MRHKVFIAKPVPKEVEDFIAEHCDYEMWRSEETIPQQLLWEKLADAEGLLTSGTRIDDELLSKAPKLKIVANSSVGYNNLDIEALRRRNVLATHTPKVLDDTVADLVFALILATARRIPELDRYVRAGRWKGERQSELFGIDVHHATLGIIGMGRIGEAIAKRGKFGFDMEILYYNRNRKPEAEQKYGAQYRPLDELLAESDFVVLMTPLTAETTRMIGERELKLMKPSAILINASRGQTVDEQALVKALQNGTIRAAGLDVFEQEPIQTDHPFLTMDNVVLAPHIGSATAKTRFEMNMLAARNLVMGVRGETPPNLIPELKPKS